MGAAGLWAWKRAPWPYATNLEITGAVRTPVGSVENVVQKAPCMRLSLPQVRQEILQTCPWVCNVALARSWPNALTVQLLERTPIAYFQADKTFFPLDAEGAVVEEATHKTPAFPTVVGSEAPQAWPGFWRQVQTLPIVVSGAVYTRRGSWNVYREDGLLFKLPIKNPIEKLRAFLKLSKNLTFSPKAIACIDLRLAKYARVRFRNPIPFAKPTSKP